MPITASKGKRIIINNEDGENDPRVEIVVR